MKAYIASDLHFDDWAPACRTAKNYLTGWDIHMNEHPLGTNVKHEQVLAPADCIIVAGDIANTYAAWCEMVKELSKHYEEVVIVLGNHDLACAWSDLTRFSNTHEKIDAYRKFVKYYPNIHLLDGNVVKIGDTRIGGCMGMWDLSFIRGGYFNSLYPDDALAHLHTSEQWKKWFDGLYWNYLSNNLTHIRELELSKVHDCLAEAPDIMVTHFCPFPGEEYLPAAHKRTLNSSFFYFDGAKTADVKLWIAGHIHEQYYRVGPNKNIVVNPIGHFSEGNTDSAKDDKWFIEL